MLREVGLSSVVCLAAIGCSEPNYCVPDERNGGTACREVNEAGAEIERDASESADDAAGDASEERSPDASVATALPEPDAAYPAGDAGSTAAPPLEMPACGGAVRNACDGCTALAHAPGTPCAAGIGECANTGVWECEGSDAVACSAKPKAASAEICDGKDNDCDMAVDEDTLSTWYQDCDGDGYAASDVGSVQACDRPAPVGGCEWTAKRPVKESNSNWDCNDGSVAYHPAADFGVPPDGFTDPDLNCDGNATPGETILTMLTPCLLELADIRANTCTYLPPNQQFTSCIYYVDQAGIAVAAPDVCPDRVYSYRAERDVTSGALKCTSAARIVQSWTCK